MKAAVAITTVNLGRLFREVFSQFVPNGLLAAIAEQRSKEALRANVQLNDLFPASLEAARVAER